MTTIPNKIKIRIDSETEELSDYWILKNETKDKDVEYVRKDVLLEWAKGRLPYGNRSYYDAMKEVINKINSL